jgi:hypothetical protein
MTQRWRRFGYNSARARLPMLMLFIALAMSVSTVPSGAAQGQHPSPRHGAVLGFSSGRGNLILFGGVSGTQVLSDTWELRKTDEGLRWKRIRISGPILKPGIALADNPTDKTLLLTGTGVASEKFELWEFDGNYWTQAENTAVLGTSEPPGTPEPRQFHAMATLGDTVVLFGGMSGTEFLNDTWQWNTATREWSRVPDVGPFARADHAMIHDGHKVLMFGGITQDTSLDREKLQELDDTWLFDGAIWQPHLSGTRPEPRNGHAMAYDPTRRIAVLFGGSTISGLDDRRAQALEDTWLWNVTAWSPDSPGGRPPPASSQHAMAYDPSVGRVIMFGGHSLGGWTGDYDHGGTWSYDGVGWNKEAE